MTTITPQKKAGEPINPYGNTHQTCESGENVPPQTTLNPPTPQDPQAPKYEAKTYRGRQECRDRWKLGVEILTLIAVIGYATIAAFQWEAMRTANALIEKQLETTDRPWIKVLGAVASHPLIFHGPEGISARGNDFVNLGIKVNIQNVGRSVALNINIRSDVIFVSMIQGAAKNPFAYPVEMQKALCSKEQPVAGLPINLFPGDDNRDQTGDDHEFPVSGNTFTIPTDLPTVRRIMPIFIGCVDYTIGVSGKIHQSGFIYELKERGSRGMLIVGNDIAIPDLALERFAFGGFYAN